MSEKVTQFVVHVKPRASRDQILGWQPDGALALRVAAAPVDGAANRRVIVLLAGMLGVAKRQVTIVSGAASSIKRVQVEGCSPDEVKRILQPRERSGVGL